MQGWTCSISNGKKPNLKIHVLLLKCFECIDSFVESQFFKMSCCVMTAAQMYVGGWGIVVIIVSIPLNFCFEFSN